MRIGIWPLQVRGESAPIQLVGHDRYVESSHMLLSLLYLIAKKSRKQITTHEQVHLVPFRGNSFLYYTPGLADHRGPTT